MAMKLLLLKGDVVDKVYKPEYKWVLRKKNRYGMDRWSKEKRDKQSYARGRVFTLDKEV